MPKIKPRVLHGMRQPEQLLDRLARRGESELRIPVQRVPKSRKGMMLCGVNVRDVAHGAFDQFYRGTELMGMWESAVVVIDVSARTIVLKKVRLRSLFKHLPRIVHDMRVY
jgi:hypothetical protein